MPELLGFIGTYTGKGSKGIYGFKLNLETGAIHLTETYAVTDNPSYLAVHKEKNWLYVVNELKQINRQETGSTSAFSFNKETAELTRLNSRLTNGQDPAYIAIDNSGKFVSVANYGNGSICIFPLLSDGNLGEMSSYIKHAGSSINPERQNSPHAHSTVFSQNNSRLYVADLGIDKIMIYHFKEGKLEPNNPPSFKGKLGAGPRHFIFHPNGSFAYLINEINSTISTLKVNQNNGGLEQIQEIRTVPEDFQSENTASDIHLSSSGKFLYGSNRGHDSLVILGVNQSTGFLTVMDHVDVRGKTPRTFCIDPTGKYLLCANMDSNQIVSFTIDDENGHLFYNGNTIDVPNPSCIVFTTLK